MAKEVKPSVGQDQIHKMLFNREIGWQELIYDLINTEQLDPWDVDLTILTERFLVKVQAYEEMDFFVSSKVLLAASLLLRIKSEFLLNKYVKSIDEILFGSKQESKSVFERIELDEEIPELVPRSPLPRFRKVSLKDLIASLSKAIDTENRRIKKEIVNRNALRETGISLPKKRFSLKERLRNLHDRLTGHFTDKKKVSYTELIGMERLDRLHNFSPLLQMENSGKLWLEQKEHFEEIHVWMKDVYFKDNGDPYADLKDGSWVEKDKKEERV